MFSSRADSLRRRRLALSRAAAESSVEAERNGDPKRHVPSLEFHPTHVSPIGAETADRTTDEPPAEDSDETAELEIVIEANLLEVHVPSIPEPAPAVDPGWEPLAARIRNPHPMTWAFCGWRPTNPTTGGWLVGDWFGEQWRRLSGRTTDLIIDATWPDGSLSRLWSHFADRVLKFRPDVVVVLFDHADARRGMENLPRFERQLEAVVSDVRDFGGVPILIPPKVDAAVEADIDRMVYVEAILGVAKERDAIVLEDFNVARDPAKSAWRLCDLVLANSRDGAPTRPDRPTGSSSPAA